MMNTQDGLDRLLGVLAERIKTRRKSLGLTQEKLAELAGLSTNFLARMEMAGRTPSLDTLVRVAAALQTQVAHLLAVDEGEWLDQTHDLASSLLDLDRQDADFVVDQFRTSVEHLRRRSA